MRTLSRRTTDCRNSRLGVRWVDLWRIWELLDIYPGWNEWRGNWWEGTCGLQQSRWRRGETSPTHSLVKMDITAWWCIRVNWFSAVMKAAIWLLLFLSWDRIAPVGVFRIVYTDNEDVMLNDEIALNVDWLTSPWRPKTYHRNENRDTMSHLERVSSVDSVVTMLKRCYHITRIVIDTVSDIITVFKTDTVLCSILMLTAIDVHHVKSDAYYGDWWYYFVIISLTPGALRHILYEA